MIRKGFLGCGILAALLYVAMNVFIPTMFPGYSSTSQTVSELSAIGAPTRTVWVLLGAVYALLIAAFGWGIWKSAGPNRSLRIVGALTAVNGVFSLFWPPMHLRGAEFTVTDTLHIIWSIATVLLMMLAIGFGAVAFGEGFRRYSITTMVILIGFGALTAQDAPRIAANLPTPMIGVWERISIAAYMLWVVVLAIALLRVRTAADDALATTGRRSHRLVTAVTANH